MTNFVKVEGSEYVINLEEVIYVDTKPVNFDGEVMRDAIRIVFNGTTAIDFSGVSIYLEDDAAKRFMAMLDRKTGAW